MAVLVLIVFVGGAWLWAYRTTPSASAITGELNAIPVNVTSEQLIRDGYIDLTKVGESSNVAVNEFLAEAKQQEAPVLKYINMERGSLTAHVLWYDPYESVPKCAPKRQSCALKNANRAICVPMCAHSSFRRALRNAFLVHSLSIDLERGTDGAPHIR